MHCSFYVAAKFIKMRLKYDENLSLLVLYHWHHALVITATVNDGSRQGHIDIINRYLIQLALTFYSAIGFINIEHI